MQHRVYRRQIHSVDELKRWLIDVWCGLEQSIFNETIDQWRGRHRACVVLKDISSTACELTMLILSISVTFNVTCLTVTSLITKSCQQRWAIHSRSFYKVLHYQIWGMVVDFWHTLSNLISVCKSERIIKIGQYMPKLSSNEQELSYRKQIARQLRTHTSRAFIGLITPWPWNLG